MTIGCDRRETDLHYGDRIFIAWPIIGLGVGDTVALALEGGAWWPLDLTVGEAVGYFAGPGFVTPGAAHVVATTSHAEIRVTTAQEQITFDGGFIRLVV